MDDQLRSSETAGNDYIENYYDDSEMIGLTAPPYSAYVGGYEDPGGGPDYSGEFGDPYHLTFTNFDQNTDLGHGAYSTDLELDHGETNAAIAAAFLSQPPSPPQYSQGALDPQVAWEEVNDDPRFQSNSSWDPVAATAVPLVPDFHAAPNTYGHVLPSSTATRSQADALSYLGPAGPSTWDGVSIGSGYTDSSSTACEMCGRQFGNSRQMRRHRGEVHGELPQYTCKCQYQAPRKSNYIRHLKTSCKKRRESGLFFFCSCQEAFSDYEAHLAHIETCGRKQPGRPPNSARVRN